VALRDPGRRRWRAWLGIALVTGSQLLVGYPPAGAYCWVIAVPYALLVAGSTRPFRPLLAVATAPAAGILLAGVQLLPTLDYLAAADRPGSSYDFLTHLSLHPLNLLTLVSPQLFVDRLYMEQIGNPVEQVFYFGVFVPLAVVWVAAHRREL